MFKPRRTQQQILDYTGGKMGVSAVPGSGKTQTLSYLAARLIIDGYVQEEQEVLVVTLVNSAVNNFSARIAGFMHDAGLLPEMNYRVRTLHGLAHDIVRERPDLLGLSERFQIVDERESGEILKDAVQSWLRAHPDFLYDYTSPEIDLSSNHRVAQNWNDLAVSLAGSFIRQSKDLQATPAMIRQALDGLHHTFPLLEMGYAVYADYQRALNYRSAVDFDDLIRLALQAISLDGDYLARLRYRWPYILEDEAQDSSRLQEQILRLLAGEDGNWVRVGDPNQAIYETFTTASPRYLRDFLNEPGVASHALPESGRSTASIIALANYLVDWTRQQHPEPRLRDALTPPHIRPTGRNDPQPNPPDQPASLYLMDTPYEPAQEIEVVVRSLQKWLPQNPERTVAVLAPRNDRGTEVVEALKRHGIEYVEMLRSSLSTRQTADVLANILRALDDPDSSSRLATVYRQLYLHDGLAPEASERVKTAHALLRRCQYLEEYLWPRPDRDWLAGLDNGEVPDEVLANLEDFRALIRRWQQATLLPIDQLLLSVAQDIFGHPAELALAHKLALLLEHAARANPDWRLPDFGLELESIARNERKLLGFGDEDTGFDPDQYKGKVVVATMHKAKGLEWDRVYLLSANNYDFPSAQEYDTFIAEKWFVRNRLNLEAETLAQLKSLLAGDLSGLYQEEGLATLEARYEYAAERLRLLYVGITRARRELVITWNTGRKKDAQPAIPLRALQHYLEGHHATGA